MLANGDLSGKTDEEIAALVLLDRQYYAVLVERYEAKLGRYIRRMTKLTQDDQHDLLQDIFIKAFINLNGFNQTLSFSSWIYRIAHNEIVSLIRKKKVRQNTFALEDAEELTATLSTDEDFVQDLIMVKDVDVMKRILESLNEKYKEILVLNFLEEKSYAEISDILKIPPGTVATRLSRAKKLLHKKCLEANIHPHE